MHLNPLTNTCADIQQQIDGLQQTEKKVADELQWYNSIDACFLTEELLKTADTVEHLRSEIQSLEKEIRENAGRVSETESVTKSLVRTSAESSKSESVAGCKLAERRRVGHFTQRPRELVLRRLVPVLL